MLDSPYLHVQDALSLFVSPIFELFVLATDGRTSFYAAIGTATKAIVKQKHKYTPAEQLN
jgi:hypothetical protein